MKRFIFIFCAAILLLSCAACAKETPQTEPTDVQATAWTPDPNHELVGCWVKSGEFDEGADYVETLTVNGDGTICVQLDYRGEPYQTLQGTYTISGRHFIVTIDAETPYTTDYHYAVDGRELTLQSETGTYLYYSE